mgnify:CR=1 FL=1
MREDFCAFILTHGRANNVKTYGELRANGYTGKIFIVIDDEDESGEEYKRIYGDDVLVFSKDEVAHYTDQFDNSSDRRTILWARNVSWDLARKMGYKFFIHLDDDYYYFGYRRMGKGHFNSNSSEEEYHLWKIRNLDAVFSAMVTLVENTPIDTIALSQGGEHQGGQPSKFRFKRKAMNSFVCDVEKPIRFRGRLNEDVNTYVGLGRIGRLFFTDMGIMLSQNDTQSSSGGTSEAYLASGTYVKAFYTVMIAPSCTSITVPSSRVRSKTMGIRRIHHKVDWGKAVPLIIPQEFKKAVNA